jgi:hypothetical protein
VYFFSSNPKGQYSNWISWNLTATESCPQYEIVSLGHNVSFWALKLTHSVSVWALKLTHSVSVWAQKLTPYDSFRDQKILKRSKFCSNGFFLILLNSYIIQSIIKLFLLLFLFNGWNSGGKNIGTKNWWNVSVSAPRNWPPITMFFMHKAWYS